MELEEPTPLSERSIRDILKLQTRKEVERIVEDTTNQAMKEHL